MPHKQTRPVRKCVGYVRDLRLYITHHGYLVENINNGANSSHATLESVFISYSDMTFLSLEGFVKHNGRTIAVRYRYTGNESKGGDEIEYIVQNNEYPHLVGTFHSLVRDIAPRSHQLLSHR